MSHNPNIHKRRYSLSEYDPAWPKLFKQYAATLQRILGDVIIEIHHLGSTSIPGMFAKPNIDIYILATSLDAVRDHTEQIQTAGFTARGDYSNIGEEYFTLDSPSGERIASIHIFEGTDAVFRPYKNFRDYLIAHPKEKERYISLKQDLYKKYADDYPAYDEGKKALIQELVDKANAWADRN